MKFNKYIKMGICVLIFMMASIIVFYLSSKTTMILGADASLAKNNDKYDMGIVYPGQSRSHIFFINNTLNSPLQIVAVRTSCGCTHARLSKSTIAPGEKVSLRLTVTAKEKPGALDVTAVVSCTSAGQDYALKYTLVGKTASIIESNDPSYYWDVGDYKLGERPLSRIMRVRRGSYPLDWDELQCRSKRGIVQSQVKPLGHGEWAIEILVEKVDVIGQLRDTLEFSFVKNGRQVGPQVNKTVVARAVGPISVSPKSLLVGAVAPGDRRIFEIHVVEKEGHEKTPIIEKVSSSGQNTIPKIVNESSDSSRRVDVTYRAPGKAGRYVGFISITALASDGKKYKVEVPYIAVVANPSASSDESDPK